MQPFDPITARLVLAVSRYGSIGRAAEHENIAPSAVSRRISELEARLGVALFDRSLQGARLTPAGEVYVSGCRQILRQVADLNTEMVDFSTGTRGSLRLACTSSSLSGRLPELLAAYAQSHPGIGLDIQEMSAALALAAMDDGQADIAFVADNNDVARFETEVFEDDNVLVLCSPEHPLAGRLQSGKPISFDAVAEHEVVGIHQSGALDRLLNEAAARSGRALGERVRVETFPSLVRMVEAGFGIGFLRSTSLHLLAGTDVISVRLSDEWASRKLLSARRGSSPLSRPIREFLALARKR
ncbi:LysR family transcriptional regulator [Shinella sp. S4-D37]|uniref:LysR family transcriptional regulator n=1 Tax=Shinella sp. S4-D37 TaxID=3161999 RepID=UPI003464E91F